MRAYPLWRMVLLPVVSLTEHLQVIQAVVASVFIFMVYDKAFRYLPISLFPHKPMLVNQGTVWKPQLLILIGHNTSAKILSG